MESWLSLCGGLWPPLVLRVGVGFVGSRASTLEMCICAVVTVMKRWVIESRSWSRQAGLQCAGIAHTMSSCVFTSASTQAWNHASFGV